jgi:hypothetical protein
MAAPLTGFPRSISAPETPPTTAPRPAPWTPCGVAHPEEKIVIPNNSKPALPITILFFISFALLDFDFNPFVTLTPSPKNKLNGALFF